MRRTVVTTVAYVLAALMGVLLIGVVGLVVVGNLRAQKLRADLGWAIIDGQGRQVSQTLFHGAGPFAEGLAPVERGGSWGYVDRSGEVVVEPIYTGARPFDSSGRAAVQRGTVWGLIDRRGGEILEPGLQRLGPFSEGVAIGTISVGLSSLMANRRSDMDYEPSTGLLLPDGSWQVPPAERDADDRWRWARGPSQGLVAVEQVGGRWRLFDVQGRPTTSETFDQLDTPSEGLVPARRDQGWGFVDRSGQWVIAPEWRSVRPFSEGVAVARAGSGVVLLGSEGQRLAGPFKALRDASEGLIAARADKKWGFIDKAGAWIIEPQFDDVAEEGFQDGYARVGRYSGLDLEWAWIDREGAVLGDLWAAELSPRAEGLGWARIRRGSEGPR